MWAKMPDLRTPLTANDSETVRPCRAGRFLREVPPISALSSAKPVGQKNSSGEVGALTGARGRVLIGPEPQS